jgi:sugar transferase (PEP-CTERM/EpsH1 system associated)
MSARPDLLYLVHRIPYPPDKGDKIRSFHLLEGLASQYRVHLGTFVDNPRDWEYAEALRQWCASLELRPLVPWRATLRSARGLFTGEPLTDPYYCDAAMHAWVRATLARERIHAIVVLSSSMAQYVPDAQTRGTRCIVDFGDVDSDKWLQYSTSARWPMSWVYRREGLRLEQREGHIARMSHASVFVSHAEAEHFRRLHPDARQRVYAVPNGVDAARFSPAHPLYTPYAPHERALVFTGAMDYWANVDAVSWFARDVLPAIRAREPRARFWIVGSNPTAAVRALGDLDGVSVTGRVADVRPYLRYAAFAVAPLRLARGVQNKVLEAMAMARPVLATSAATRGIDAATPPGVVIADSPESLAQAALFLLEADDLASRGAAARRYVTERFDWDASRRAFLALLTGEPGGSLLRVHDGGRP